MNLLLNIELGSSIATPSDLIEAITASIGQYESNSNRLFTPLRIGDTSTIQDADRKIVGHWVIATTSEPQNT